MSPEQAAWSEAEVDTRTDVYLLGALLYELLTGDTPLERRRLREAAFTELRRRVREDDPPRPSMRLSTAEEVASIAVSRGTEPAKLARLVRGDLDWIMMRALEKDPARRYETADGLARDIQRHLDGDPVEAGPPAAAYLLRKLAGKHRGMLLTASGFAAVLVAATANSSYLSMSNLASSYKESGRLDQALTLFEQTLKLSRIKLGADDRGTLTTLRNLAVTYKDSGRLSEGLPLFEEALRLRVEGYRDKVAGATPSQGRRR